MDTDMTEPALDSVVVTAVALKLPDCPPVDGIDPCSRCGARSVSVCGSLAGPGLRQLAALADVQTVGANEPLVREGDSASHLFNITSGSVRVYKLMADGRRQIVGFLYTGDFLGLATGDSYAFSAEALEPVTACRFRKTEYRRLLQDQPMLESALLERASHELAAAQDQMLLLGRKTALERFASFLLDTAKRQRRTDIVHLSMTRAEIADYLGLTTETVSRVTSKLKTSGVIRLVALNEIALLKPATLAEIADGS